MQILIQGHQSSKFIKTSLNTILTFAVMLFFVVGCGAGSSSDDNRAVGDVGAISAKAVTKEAKITGLYVAYFNRAADQEGLTYWTDKAVEVAQAGGDISLVFKKLSAGFATHPTFKSTYDHLNNEEFVKAIYRNALGRAGDAEGIAYWTDLLDRVMIRSDMVATFVELSLVTDLTPANYPNLTAEELAAAQLRQDLITNKVNASLAFTHQLGTLSNVEDSQDPEQDPAYLASIQIISEVTEDPATVSTVIGFLNGIKESDDPIKDILAVAAKYDFEKVIIGSEGGDFNLSNGINLSIPADAVPEETTFQFRVVQETEVVIPDNIFKTHDKNYLAGFEAIPYGYQFAKPISISIPSVGLADSTSIPYLLSLNTVTNEVDFSEGLGTGIIDNSSSRFAKESGTNTNTNTNTNKIQINCDTMVVMPAVSALPSDNTAAIAGRIKNVLPYSDCAKDPCRCCDFFALSKDFSSGSTKSDECHSAYSDGFVQYLECEGQPIEPWSLQSATLNVTVSPNDAEINVEEYAVFLITLTNAESGQPVTNFSIEEVIINDTTVITELSRGNNTVSFKGVSSGISSAELLITAGGCQYKGWLSVEVDSKIVVERNSVSILEGESETVGVKLGARPSENHQIQVSSDKTSGDEDISIELGDTMLFSHLNWDTYQPLVLAAAEDDDDAVNGKATITVTSEGGIYGSKKIIAKEIDNDKVNFVTDKNTVFVPECGKEVLKVKLNKEPPSTVNTTVSKVAGGDPDISIKSGSTLVFSESNWDTYQPVTLRAEWDDDLTDGSAQIKISGIVSGEDEVDLEDKIVTVKEDDLNNLSLDINGSFTKKTDYLSFVWQDEWSSTVPLTIIVGSNGPPTVKGEGTMDYRATGSAMTYDIDANGNKYPVPYTLWALGVVNITVNGIITCLEEDGFSLGMELRLIFDYTVYSSLSDSPTHHIEDYEDIITFTPQNNYTLIHDEEYEEQDTWYKEYLRLELLRQ